MSKATSDVKSPSESEAITRSLAGINEARNAASAQISSQLRAFSLGVLALAWLMLSGNDELMRIGFAAFTTSLIWISALCVASLAFDLLQYTFTLVEAELAYSDSENAETADEAGFDEWHPLRITAYVFFGLKIALTLAAACWLLVIIFCALTTST